MDTSYAERLTQIFVEALGLKCPSASEEWNRAKAKRMTRQLLLRVDEARKSIDLPPLHLIQTG